jgi:hypothetical protein
MDYLPDTASFRADYIFEQWNYLSSVVVYSKVMSRDAVSSDEVLRTGCTHIRCPTHVK